MMIAIDGFEYFAALRPAPIGLVHCANSQHTELRPINWQRPEASVGMT